MASYDWDENEPYVVIEQRPPGIGSFLTGLALGAVVALLYAPRTGAETRRDLQRRAREIGDQAQDLASDLTESVSLGFQQAKEGVEERVGAARDVVDLKRRQVSSAVDAGRAAARQARVELEQRIAETKASYKES